MHNKWAKRMHAAISSDLVTEGQIRGMKRKFTDVARAGSYGREMPKGCTVDEMEKLVTLTSTIKPRVTDAQARKGADWLYGQVFTPTGRERQTEFAAEFSAADKVVIKQLRDNPHFTLVGWQDIGHNFPFYVPVYAAIGLDSHFRYAAVAWQSGRSFVIRHA